MIVTVPLLLTAEAHLGSDWGQMAGSPDGAPGKAMRRDPSNLFTTI